MASVLKASDIVREFGQYYVNEGQNRQRLVRALTVMPTTLEKHARHIRTTETTYKMANYRFGSVLQPFSPTFNPISDIEFIANEIPLHKIKVNARFTPDEIENSWLGFMSGNTTRNKKDWPIVRFLLEEYLANQINEDREMNMVYLGERNDAGTTPGSCVDGIHKLLVDGAAKTKYPINVISGLGEFTEANAFDYVEAFDKAIDPRYWNHPVTIFVAPEMYRAFLTAYRANGFYTIFKENDINGVIDFTGRKHVLAPLPSMAGTKHIFATVPDNLIWLTNRDMNTTSADIQAIHYDVDLMLDWWEGIGFACNKMVWTTAETIGAPSAVDTASPADGIVVRSIYPMVAAATDVDHESAKVSGEVLGNLPEGATVKVNYGTSTSLGTQSSSLTATNGKYTATLGSLSASTKYYYRLEVTIGTDKYVSETKDFTTEAAPAAGGES